MSFSQFISIMRARWWVVLLVLFLTVGTTLAVGLWLPKIYTATATLVLDVKPDPIAGQAYQGLTTPAYINTQVDIMKSDRVAQRVVRNLKLVENPQVRHQWLEDTKGNIAIEHWLSESFQTNMEVRPSRESNVISLSYRSSDPRFAAALANAFVKSYIDTALELKVDPARQYASFFDARSKEARERLEQAQGRLSAFQKENGIIANDERFDVESARLNELSQQVVLAQAQSAEAGSRQAQALAGQAERLQEVLNNGVISSLKADLSRAEARLQELNSRLGDNHPQVAEAKANMTSLRGRLDAETRRVTGGVGVAATINRQREAELRGSLESQRAKVLRMKAVRDEGSVLQRDVESAQRSYDAVLGRLNQTSLESQTTQGNVNVLAEAQPPVLPSSPKIVLNTLLSLIIGSGLAVGAALLLELIDRRVRGSDDLDVALGLPVLGVMPDSNAIRLPGQKRLSLMQQRLVASLPAPQKG